MERELLEQFRDLKINKSRLYEMLPCEIKELVLDTSIEVCSNHLIHLLESFQRGDVSENALLDWVNTIWFSGLYEYCDEHCDSIASVMNELEEIDEDGKIITCEKVSQYINALKNNVEV